jgi:hypothetical protein
MAKRQHYEISKKKVRDGLKPRGEPYWQSEPLAEHLRLGFRKHKDGGGVWIARYRKSYSEGDQQTYRIGLDVEYSYLDAKKVALDWYDNSLKRGIDRQAPTLKKAAEEYLAYVLKDSTGHRRDKDRAHKDAKWRIEQYINAHALASVPIDEIREDDLQDWFDALEGKAASKNRNLTLIKAVLNYAVSKRRVAAEMADEWRRVKRIKVERHQRRREDVYLTVEERRAIIDACEGDFADYVRAVALTGCRPGDPAQVRAEDFDGKGVIFRTKVAPTRVTLAPQAQALFKQLAKGKTPKAYLFPRQGADPYKYSNDWSRPFKDAVRKATRSDKLDKVKAREAVLYSFRHSFITDALMSGIRTFEVAEICRTSVKMIEDHYAHVIPDDIEQRLAKVPML